MKLFIVFFVAFGFKNEKLYSPLNSIMPNYKSFRFQEVYFDIRMQPRNYEQQTNWINAYNWTEKDWDRYQNRNERFIYFRFVSNRNIEDDSVKDLN